MGLHFLTCHNLCQPEKAQALHAADEALLEQACLLAAVTTAARGERVAWLDTSTFFNAHHAAAFYQALPASPHVRKPLSVPFPKASGVQKLIVVSQNQSLSLPCLPGSASGRVPNHRIKGSIPDLAPPAITHLPSDDSNHGHPSIASPCPQCAVSSV